MHPLVAIDDGDKPGVASAETRENRELRKRVKLLEQENEVLRRAAAHLSTRWSSRSLVTMLTTGSP